MKNDSNLAGATGTAQNTISIKCKTTDGTMFVFFIEDEEGKCKRVMIQIGKTGSGIRAWTESLMATVNLALANRTPLIEISNELSNITTDKLIVTGEENSKIRSGPAGFVYAVTKYLRFKSKPITTPWEIPWL